MTLGDRSLAVWGASGHGRVVADTARRAGWRTAWFIDDDSTRSRGTADGSAVLPGDEGLARAVADDVAVALGVGDNAARQRLHARVQAASVRMPVLVHPSAVVAESASLGEATLVAALAVINPGARVGRGVIINTGAVVEHDCELDDFSHVSPGAVLSGGVRVGAAAHIGAGAVVLPGCVVGARAVVGAGAVVTRDVAAAALVTGVPARDRSLAR